MVALVLRLRFDLLVGALRVDPRRSIAGVVAAVLAVAAAVVAIARLAESPLSAAHAVLAVGGSAISAGFLLLPLMASVRDPLDPRRFGVVGASWQQVAGATLLASLVSVPALAVVVVAVAVAVTWIAQGAHPVWATAGALVLAATQILFARVAMAVAALVLSERRSRELTALFLLGTVVVAVPIAVFLGFLDWGGGVPTPLIAVADVLALTPLGAAWLFAIAPGAATVLAAIATVLALVGAWVLLVRRMLTHGERPVSVRERRGLGWFTVTPGTPGGAVAARALIYWLRDPRYLADVAVIPVAAVAVVVPLLIVGVEPGVAALIPAPIIALFLGWLVHNDVAYDGSAVWLHVSSAVRGVSDRVGRLVPLTLVALPLLAAAISLGVGIHGEWAALPAMIGLCAALLGSGLGLSSVSSVLAPYPVARPGESPFQQPQRTGGGLAQGVVLVGAAVASAPAGWGMWRYLQDELDAQWWTLGVGLGTGILMLLAGVVVGGMIFERRGDRVMAFAATT